MKTIAVDEDTHRALRIEAATRGITLGALVAEKLGKRDKDRAESGTSKGPRLNPGQEEEHRA